MINGIWLVFHLHIFFLMIVLMNFLIAVVSQTFSDVMLQALLMRTQNIIDMDIEGSIFISSTNNNENKIIIFSVP